MQGLKMSTTKSQGPMISVQKNKFGKRSIMTGITPNKQ